MIVFEKKLVTVQQWDFDVCQVIVMNYYDLQQIFVAKNNNLVPVVILYNYKHLLPVVMVKFLNLWQLVVAKDWVQVVMEILAYILMKTHYLQLIITMMHNAYHKLPFTVMFWNNLVVFYNNLLQHLSRWLMMMFSSQFHHVISIYPGFSVLL